MKLYRSRKVKYYYFPVTLRASASRSAKLLPTPHSRWKIILERLKAKQWADDGITTTYISSKRLIFKYDGLKIEPAFTLILLIGTRFPPRVFSRTKKPACRHPPCFAIGGSVCSKPDRARRQVRQSPTTFQNSPKFATENLATVRTRARK